MSQTAAFTVLNAREAVAPQDELFLQCDAHDIPNIPWSCDTGCLTRRLLNAILQPR